MILKVLPSFGDVFVLGGKLTGLVNEGILWSVNGGVDLGYGRGVEYLIGVVIGEQAKVQMLGAGGYVAAKVKKRHRNLPNCLVVSEWTLK